MRVTEHPEGNFCWAELVTSDGNAAKAFYTGLFGWRSEDNPMGPEMVYTTYYKGEGSVGASYNEQEQPPHWGAYILSKNADETVHKARLAHGTVVMEPFDVMEFGRMAVLQDPTGAFVSVWQPKQHVGYTLVDEPGAVCWNELITTDRAAAGSFYASVFGWDPRPSEVGGADYTEFYNQGKSIAGMMARTAEMGDTPPNWTVYFQVEDCDATVAKAASLGGSTFAGPMDIPKVGRFAILGDPQGAAFGILKVG